MINNRRATFPPPHTSEPEAFEKVADKETRGVAIAGIILAAAALGCAVTGAVHNIQQNSELAADQAAIDDLHSALAEGEASQLGGAIDPANLAEALATPCPTEDSENCVWYGGANGAGDAFVTVEGHVFPLTSGLE